jgi:hypothetical protein
MSDVMCHLCGKSFERVEGDDTKEPICFRCGGPAPRLLGVTRTPAESIPADELLAIVLREIEEVTKELIDYPCDYQRIHLEALARKIKCRIVVS